MAFCGMPEEGPAKGCGSEELATAWKPYIETCIEAFGASRAMFESNYPVDRWGAIAWERLTGTWPGEERPDPE